MACGAVAAQELPEVVSEAAGAPDAPSVASHITFGSNLLQAPCSSCRYSEAGGYFVLGPDNCTSPGTTQWLGVPFIAAASGVPERISAAIILADPRHCPNRQSDPEHLQRCLLSAACGSFSGVATVPKAPSNLAVAKVRNAAALTEGTKYWVVATTNAQQTGFDANWYVSNNAQSANSAGDDWTQYPGGTPAFLVQGSGTFCLLLRLIPPTRPSVAICSWTPVPVATTIPTPAVSMCGAPENCTSPGTTAWLAVPFISAATGVPRRISASIVLYNPTFCPENKVTLSLYADNCGLGPETLLASGIATVPTALRVAWL